MELTTAQLAQYQRDGFLALENFVTPAACAALRGRVARLLAQFAPRESVSIFSTRDQARTTDDYFLASGDKVHFFFEEDAFLPDGRLRQRLDLSINKIGHALHDLDPVFDGFSRTPALARLVADLGIAAPLLLQSMYIFKQPRIGGEVVCHQDATFLYTEPVSVTGLWFALEDATIANGCLWAIPGGHRQGLKSRFMRDGLGGTRFDILDTTPWPDADLVPLEAPQGTLIILHGLAPHLSRANTSGVSRHAWSVHVIDGASQYPAGNWLQRDPGMPLRGFA
ncbi:MAG: phytanoyl-CoA dioxygenase family protein [Blastocatellia bacterium]